MYGSFNQGHSYFCQKKQAIIVKTMTGAIYCYLLGYINILCKLIKKDEYDKLIELYILSKFRSKNTYPLDK